MTLTQPIFLKLLDWAARTTDRDPAERLHQGARALQLRVFTPAFTRYLRARTAQGLRLLPRNSFSSGRDFNMFRSDLDYEIVLRGEANPVELARLREAYASARRRLPFIGELEIYTHAEWEAKRDLREAADPPFACLPSLIHEIRRIHWQLEAQATAPSAYHREKARRSIARGLRKLGAESGETALPQMAPAIAAVIEKRIRPLREAATLPPGKRPALTAGLQAQSSYLGFALSAGVLPPDPRALELPGETLLYLAALLPDGADCLAPHAPLADAVSACRSHPRVAETYLIVLLNELLTCRSVRRTRPQEDHRTDPWIAHLEQEIARALPRCQNERVNHVVARI